MASGRLLVLHASECSGEASRLAAAIRRHWPEPTNAPHITTAHITAAPEDLDTPVVYVLGPAGALEHESVLNRAWAARRPAIVLAPTLADREHDLRGRGMIVERLDFPPPALAGVVFGMLARQCVIDELRTDLRVAMVSSGGVAGEIERLQDEMQLAASVQRDLMPRRLPATDRLEVGVLFRPVGYVSGDIYDAELIDDRYLAFFVADAVGHGVPAALMTMVISQSLRRLERRAGAGRMTPPADVLRALNADLIRRQDSAQRFATAVYGVLDTHTLELRVASAGHPAPLLLSSTPTSPRCQPLATGGPLLGIFDDAEFDEVSAQLSPAQTLLVYSDGFEVAFPQAHADEHQKRLPTRDYLGHLAELADPRGRGLSDALERLDDALNAQFGSLRQADDITALAIAVLADPVPASAPMSLAA